MSDNTLEYVEQQIVYELGYAYEQVKQAQNRIEFLNKYTPLLKEALISLNGYSNTVLLGSASHEQAISLIKGFGTRFEKSYKNDFVQYSATIDGITVKIASTPPNACKIVEYEEEVPEKIVPAHKVVKRRIECPKQEEVAA